MQLCIFIFRIRLLTVTQDIPKTKTECVETRKGHGWTQMCQIYFECFLLKFIQFEFRIEMILRNLKVAISGIFQFVDVS